MTPKEVEVKRLTMRKMTLKDLEKMVSEAEAPEETRVIRPLEPSEMIAGLFQGFKRIEVKPKNAADAEKKGLLLPSGKMIANHAVLVRDGITQFYFVGEGLASQMSNAQVEIGDEIAIWRPEGKEAEQKTASDFTVKVHNVTVLRRARPDAARVAFSATMHGVAKPLPPKVEAEDVDTTPAE